MQSFSTGSEEHVEKRLRLRVSAADMHRDAYATIQSSVVNIAGARGVCRGADACVSYNVARMSANGPSVRPGTVQYVTVYI